MLNTNKIEKELVRQTISKAKLCKKAKIARPTLDAILNGGDARISTIEAIASVLNVRICYLFDEENREYNTAQTEGNFSPANLTGNISQTFGETSVLAERIRGLEALIAAKDELISALKRDQK